MKIEINPVSASELGEILEPDVDLFVGVRDVFNPGHYPNLKKHIRRESIKYKNIDFSVKYLTDDNRDHTVAKHIFIEINFKSDNHAAGNEYLFSKLVSTYNALSSVLEIYCATIVAGENDPGKYIMPCLHILCAHASHINEETIISFLDKNPDI